MLQQARGQTFNRPPTACKLTVSRSFSLPLLGFFSLFPRGTGSLSVTQEYLALPRGRGGFTRGFTRPELLGIRPSWFHFRLQDFYLLWCCFQQLRLTSPVSDGRPTTPCSRKNKV